jgi:hypothetical protein
MSGIQQSEREIAGIEQTISKYMANRGALASSMKQMERVIGLDRKRLWAAVRRLEGKREIFRFDVDGEPYMVRWRFRKQAHVQSAEPVFSSPEIEFLYSIFGTRSPSIILRTPLIKQTDEEEVDTYNRYMDDDDAGEDSYELCCENSGIHAENSLPPA